MISLAAPWMLALLPFAALAAVAAFRTPRVRVSDSALVAGAGRGLVARLRPLLPLLRVLALALLAVCLARPIKANEQTRVLVDGIAIGLVVDRSGSMEAMDFTIGGEPATRLAALKETVRDFVSGGDGLVGRPNDLVGLVTFSRFADSICPLTLDHEHLLAALDAVRLAANREEDGTAIGEGIALGVERLKEVGGQARPALPDGTPAREPTRPPVKSRVLILLTDGENNAGEIDPLAAADLAKAYGIRIYTIGMGTRGLAPFPARDPFGNRVMTRVQVLIDEDLLTEVANRTGGKYFRATDSRSLAAIYAEIDRLEKTETEQRRYLQWTDLAVTGVRLGDLDLPPLLALVAILLAADLLLASTRFRSPT
jgi:Ca-activated chloride channel family protein